jgi:hypothetical protein
MAPPAWPETLFENVVLLMVTVPSELQLIPAALFAPAVQLFEMTALARVSESFVPPPRIAPPPNACAAPFEMVTPVMLTATFPAGPGSSSKTRSVPLVHVDADWRMMVEPEPAPTMMMVVPEVMPT